MFNKEDIVDGLQNNEFFPVFQPIVLTPPESENLFTKEEHSAVQSELKKGIVGFEMLLRWYRNGVYVQPDIFFREAELIGMASELWQFSTSQAFEFASKMEDRYFVSVNVTPSDILRPEFEDFIEAQQKKYSVDFSKIHFEITEQSIDSEEDSIKIESTVEKMKEKYGAYFSIDDFGVGHSSLERILRIKADQIKIDKSFVKNISNDHRTRCIVKAVSDMCKSIGVDTVIEGIETVGQVSAVQGLGIQSMQGFFISRPIKEAEALSFVKSKIAPVIIEEMPPSLCFA